MQNSVRRVEWLDLARGIGIILVVYGHVVHSVFGREFAEYTSNIFAWSEEVVYSFHMPLFFFISGCFFTSYIQKEKAGAILCKRIDVLLYPYVIWSLIQGVVEVIVSNSTAVNVSMGEVLVSLFIHPRAHFWFLYDLFIMNVIVVAVFKLLQKKGMLLLLLCAVVIFAFHDNVHGFRGNFLFFIGGILVGHKLFLLEKIPVNILVLFASIVLFVLFHYMNIKYDPVFFGVFRFLFASIGILLALAASVYLVRFKKENKFNVTRHIIAIGKSSLFIYLVHVLAYQSFFQLIGMLGLQHKLFYILGGTLVGIIAPYIFFSVLEKYNIRLLHKADLSAYFLRQ